MHWIPRKGNSHHKYIIKYVGYTRFYYLAARIYIAAVNKIPNT